MGKNEEELPNEQENVNSQASTQNTSKESMSKAINKGIKQFKNSKVASKSLVKAVCHVLASFGWIILIIIALIGIIMFLLTMPGMVMEKIKGMFKTIANGWNAWWGEDTTTQFDEYQIYQVVDYLDEMGYDLKGYGIVTEFLSSTSQYNQGGAETEATGLKVTKDGVIRDENDTVVTAESEFINVYLISENYIYTIKNFNLDDTTGWTAFWNHVSALFSATSALGDRTGMLVFWHDTGEIGERDGAYGATERGYIKFDTESKKLLIKKGWTNGAMSYSLDGWTGRYGMPVDFLLSVHIATQMPDLAYDMATTFDTEVNILLNSSEGTVYGAYKVGTDDYVTYDEIMKAFDEIDSTNFIADIINKVDNSTISTTEIQNIHDLGIYPPNGCDCTKSDDGEITEVGSDCKEYIKFIANRMMKASDDSYKTYTPYIESVQNHWFRDVYFVSRKVTDDEIIELNDEFVDYDYQYELITGERWTLYETNDDGSYKYYLLNEDGSTGEEYTGNVTTGETVLNGEDGEPLRDSDGNILTERIAARGENGEIVVKKAVTIDLSEKYEDLGWNVSTFDSGVYIAYDTDNGDATPNYDAMYSDEDMEGKSDLEKDAMEHMYIEVAITSITQTGEGLRTETNSEIKKMFLSNNYFKYDGSRQRAEIIYALREASGVGYGAIDDDMLDKTYDLTFSNDSKYTSEAEDGEYRLGDYVGNVSFQQDSLNAFAILENSHTLDSDYIYKDFKELVVELGYFEKEELTESTPQLLQWIVPDIGSNGFPERSIDKREGEYGTLVHSKMDIEANEKSTIYYLLQSIAENEDEELKNSNSELDGNTTTETTKIEGIQDQSISQSTNVGYDLINLVGNSSSDGEKDFSQVSVEEFLEKAKEIMDYMMENNFRYYSHPRWWRHKFSNVNLGRRKKC